MAVAFDQKWTSLNASGSKLTIRYIATGTQSAQEVREAAIGDFSTFPPQNGPFWRNDEELSVDQIEGLLDHFDVTVVWEFPTRKSEKEKRQSRANGDSHWEIDTTSQAVRVSNAKASQIKLPGETFEDTEDTAIGYSSATDEVEGTDRLSTTTELRLSFYKPAALVTDAFRTAVENLLNPNKTNDDEFLEYEIGELLITGAKFSNDAENFDNIRCDYTFLVDRQRIETLENVGEVTIPPHYHLDVQYGEFDDPNTGRKRRRPVSAKRHRLYDGGDFAPLIATS